MIDLTCAAPCSKCGCVGLHACSGAPIHWTPEDEARLEDALRDVAKQEKRDGSLEA